MRKAALYICYYTVTEPLVQTQVLPYLVELTGRGLDVTLLSFEPREISRQELDHSAKEIASHGIRWHHLRYHRRPSLIATLYDVVVGTLTAACICLRLNIRIVHARSHVAAAIGLSLKRILGIRLIFDMRGLLADEYADAGHWSKNSIKYRLTKRLETAFLNQADQVVVLTRRIQEELASTLPGFRKRLSTTMVIPCCIDPDRFAAQAPGRESLRAARGWSDRKVIVYAGKLGGWYMTREMIDFFAAARAVDIRFFFQVLTQGDPQFVESSLLESGVPHQDFDVRYVSSAGMPDVLAACDAGISFIRPCYSKLASSPTKVGEYLGVGLPVITTAAIGDCDAIFSDPRLGVVISAFDEPGYRRAALMLSEILEDPSGRHYRRHYAAAELSIQSVAGPRYAAVYDQLLGEPLDGPQGLECPDRC